MKKEYIEPILKKFEIKNDPLLITVSTGDDNPKLEVDDEGGDVDDALGKGNFWDE